MSTAKSMANQYLSAKRAAAASKSSTLSPMSGQQQHRFKSSTSNLASNSISGRLTRVGATGLKATSMTNLASENNTATRLQRPASRNALDTIHNGMNAKYAQVQSKVLLQNIRPQPGQQQQQQLQTKIPATRTGDTLNRRANLQRSTPSPVKAPNERSAMINKLKSLQEELDKNEQERETLKQELERERADKQEQLQQIKSELQEKIAEHDKQNEEYHQKLLEAYELADQNRRAADQVLGESRQRAEETRKKTEELEGQLGELKEFVSMKEEMTDKMYELKEQIREERQRYEEQLKNLHQVFENEKISQNQLFPDQNSNYFSRIKPSLEASSESISQATSKGCRKCRSGSSQLHKSEQDMYGSKLSTRVQDTAKSAWKSSKKFASSVITGGVNLTGCRKGSSDLKRVQHQQQTVFQQQQQQQQQQREVLNTHHQLDDSEQHTSVVQVNASINGANADLSMDAQQQQQQQQDPSLIRVDASKKLTIVTKFNVDQLLRQGQQSSKGSSPTGHSSIEMAPPSSGASERSRCESSSSGRGTSSDAGSAASQNGDDKEEHLDLSKKMDAVSAGATGECEPSSRPQANKLTTNEKRTHKRRASSSRLFKASKVVFGGSQASLNKLKNFFNAGKPLKPSLHQSADHQNQEPGAAATGVAAEIADAENSRLRCMELNQAIKVPSISGQTQQMAAAELHGHNHNKNDDDDDNDVGKVDIGQGEEERKSDQQQHQPATVVVCQ